MLYTRPPHAPKTKVGLACILLLLVSCDGSTVDSSSICDSDDDCDGVCVAGQCMDVLMAGQPCQEDGTLNCQDGASCESGICVFPDDSPCSKNSQCQTTCIGSICTPFATFNEACDESDDADCAPGTTCQNARCHRNDGEACQNNTECSQSCVAGVCSDFRSTGETCDPSDDHDCAVNHQCLDGICRLRDGEGCSANSDCTETCIGGECAPLSAAGGTCDAADDCTTGTDCAGGVCVLAHGESCSNNDECIEACIDPDGAGSATRTCAPASELDGPCDVDDGIEDCAATLDCSAAGLCRPGNGQSCETNDDCAHICADADGPGIGERQCADALQTGDYCDQADESLGQSDCAAGLGCFGGQCFLQNGERCTSNDECAGVCVDPDGAGGIARSCADASGVGESCDTEDSNADCATNHSCDAITETCLKNSGESCDTNEECSATCRQNVCGALGTTGQACDPLDDNDCSATHTCAPGSNTCLLKNGQGCTENVDCLNTCVNDQCVELGGNNAACDPGDDGDCIAGRVCEAGSNICLCDGNDCPKEDGQQCTLNAECANVCIQNICSPQSSTRGACETNTDCVTGHTCENSVCLRENGQSCSENNECANVCINQRCAAISGTGGDCDTSDLNTDCEANHTCSDVTETCLLENGQSCTANMECNETCLGNTCAPPASTLEPCDDDDNDDCAPNHVCQTTLDQCVLVNDQACTIDAECEHTCIDGVCTNFSSTGEACDARADCLSNHECIDENGGGVCRLHNESACVRDTDCINTCVGSVCGDLVYVDIDATSGTNDGTSWANAYLSLADALNDVTGNGVTSPSAPMEIWIAAGTYHPTQTCPGGLCVVGLDQGVSLELANHVGLYGGFSGNEHSMHERDVQGNKTVLSGDIDQDGDTLHDAGNSYHVVTAAGVGETAILDGFWVQDGVANSTCSSFTACHTAANSGGGGADIDGGSPILRNITFAHNWGKARGGGLRCRGGGTLLIEDSLFANNQMMLIAHGPYGAGLANIDCDLTLTRTKFISNRSAYSGGDDPHRGGAIYTTGGSLLVQESLFVDNTTKQAGGAVKLDGGDSAIFENSVFAGNATWRENSAGYVVFDSYDPDTPLIIKNSLLVGNTSYNNSYTIRCGYRCDLFNVTMSMNQATHSDSATMGLSAPLAGQSNLVYNSVFWNNEGSDDILGDTDVKFSSINEVQSGASDTSVTELLVSPFDDGPTGGTWSSAPTYNAETFQTTLTNASAGWIPDELVGLFLQPDITTGRLFPVLGNDASTVTIWGNVTFVNGTLGETTETDSYAFHNFQLAAGAPPLDAGNNEALLSGSGVCSEAGAVCLYEDATADAIGNPRFVDNAVADTGRVGASNLACVDQGALEAQ